MPHDQAKYHICQYLDSEFKIMTLSLDEFVPVLMLLLTGFLVNSFIFAGLSAIALVLVIRKIKKGRGRAGLLILAYWYLSFIPQLFFKSSPSAAKRYWV